MRTDHDVTFAGAGAGAGVGAEPDVQAGTGAGAGSAGGRGGESAAGTAAGSVAGSGGEAVRARGYGHPWLGGRIVVRLAGEVTGTVSDAEMALLGFGPPRVSGRLPGGRAGTPGYPGWALAGDPGHAGAALAAVAGMREAARLAASRPAAAAERFAAVADGLPVPHLPGFWEQAGRCFLDAGHPQRAAAMLCRARTAEAAHRLPASEPARLAVFLEFALAGALPVKVVTGYAAGLAGGRDPGAAHAALLALVFGYTRGGLPPWPALPRQLRSSARAAGLDPAAEERRVLSELLRVPAVRCAQPAFWKAYRGRLVRLARRSPELREALLYLFPEADIDEWWLELLGEAGALDDLAAGDASAWLGRMAAHLRRGRRGGRTPRRLLDLVGRLRPGGGTVRLAQGTSWRADALDADLLDACLAAGLPVEDPRPGVTVDLTRWLDRRERDLAAIGADPRYGRLLSAAVGTFAARRGVDTLLGVAALGPLVRDWIRTEAAQVDRGGMADAREAVARLESGVGGPRGGRAGALLPEAREVFARIDLAVPLRRTLMAGILDELGWRDLDRAADELGPDAETTASWPVITVYTRRRAVAVGPAGRVAEHDLRLPPGAESFTVVYSSGAFLVAWDDGGAPRGYWTGPRPRSGPLAGERPTLDPRAGYGYAFLDGAGARVTGRRVLRPGELRLSDTPRLLCDGVTYWAQPEAWRPELRELDPSTGELGAASLPGFLQDAPVPPGHEWAVDACTLAPLPEGLRRTPLGTDGTLVGFRVAGDPAGGHLIEGVDGRRAVLPGHDRPVPWGLIDLPGTASRMALAGDPLVWLVDPADGAAHWQVAAGTRDRWAPGGAGLAAPGTPVVPPPAFWHFLTPRDPEGSAALRKVSAAAVRALLDATVADLAGDPRRADLPRAQPLVDALVGHPRLRRGVAGFARQAADLRLRLDALLGT